MHAIFYMFNTVLLSQLIYYTYDIIMSEPLYRVINWDEKLTPINNAWSTQKMLIITHNKMQINKHVC